MNPKALPVPVVLLIIVSLLVGIFFFKLQNAPGRGGGQGSASTPTPTISPLAVENLKNYASQLGLDTQKFNQCLDSGQKANKVKDDISQANSLNINGTPAFFINGRFLGGAFPWEIFKEIIDKELAGKGSNDPKDYSSVLQEAAQSQAGQPALFNPKPVTIQITDQDLVRGSAGAKVTIVEFSDFQCPYCVRAYPTVKQVLQSYGQDVRLVFKNYPLPFHQYAEKAAEAALCAGEQGKFWEYHDQLFDSQSASQSNH